MTTFQKFSTSFTLALALHLAILASFAIDFSNEPEAIKQKQLPEIIQASMLDDVKIQEEANRLKEREQDKKQAQKKQQQDIENKRKKEQNLLKKEQDLLKKAKKKRLEQERQVKDLVIKQRKLEKKRKEQALKEQQKLKQIKKDKAIEAAHLAKIKQQKEVEIKRLDDLRKAKENKREQERKAEQQRQDALVAKQKAEAADKAAKLMQQAALAKAKKEQNRQATLSATAAIQQKVNHRWIKPILSGKGLNCTIRVTLLPSGDVMDATVVRSSGDTIFDRSAENAVRKASPLPVPKDRALFTKQFRAFKFEFKPE